MNQASPAIPAAIVPLVRRAILDVLHDVGGEQNDDYLQIFLTSLGHRVSRRGINEQLVWLSDRNLVACEDFGPLVTVRILADGRDVATGRLVMDGVWRHKTGD